MELKKLQNFGMPEQPTSALQVSDSLHKIKGRIGPNLAFLYGGHDLGRRATKKLLHFRFNLMPFDIKICFKLQLNCALDHSTYKYFSSVFTKIDFPIVQPNLGNTT
jgi:hypothetical protein